MTLIKRFLQKEEEVLRESDQIRRELTAAASRGALHHALLLTGEGDLSETARYAAAAYECVAAGERP